MITKLVSEWLLEYDLALEGAMGYYYEDAYGVWIQCQITRVNVKTITVVLPVVLPDEVGRDHILYSRHCLTLFPPGSLRHLTIQLGWARNRWKQQS